MVEIGLDFNLTNELIDHLSPLYLRQVLDVHFANYLESADEAGGDVSIEVR